MNEEYCVMKLNSPRQKIKGYFVYGKKFGRNLVTYVKLYDNAQLVCNILNADFKGKVYEKEQPDEH
jgi:hypothetical protein